MGSYDNELYVQMLLELLEMSMEGINLTQRAMNMGE